MRDRNVVDHLSSKVDHLQNARGEAVLESKLVANETFDWFEDRSIGTPSVRPEGNKVRIQPASRRRGPPGEELPDQVRVVFNDTTQRTTCSTYFEGDVCVFDVANDKRGEKTTERTEQPLADWVFRCVAPAP